MAAEIEDVAPAAALEDAAPAPEARPVAVADPTPRTLEARASLEVDGFDGTLMEAIDTGAIVPPERIVTFREWTNWRSGPGRRLHQVSMLAPSESALWRTTMAALHGSEWQSNFGRVRPPSAAVSALMGPPEAPPQPQGRAISNCPQESSYTTLKKTRPAGLVAVA